MYISDFLKNNKCYVSFHCESTYKLVLCGYLRCLVQKFKENGLHLLKLNRSRHGRRSVRKGVLRNFSKFTRKHLCQSLFIKKETLAQVISCECCEISKNTFFLQNTFGRLLLVGTRKRSMTKYFWSRLTTRIYREKRPI